MGTIKSNTTTDGRSESPQQKGVPSAKRDTVKVLPGANAETPLARRMMADAERNFIVGVILDAGL
jgi:hypothetical protein